MDFVLFTMKNTAQACGVRGLCMLNPGRAGLGGPLGGQPANKSGCRRPVYYGDYRKPSQHDDRGWRIGWSYLARGGRSGWALFTGCSLLLLLYRGADRLQNAEMIFSWRHPG